MLVIAVAARHVAVVSDHHLPEALGRLEVEADIPGVAGPLEGLGSDIAPGAVPIQGAYELRDGRVGVPAVEDILPGVDCSNNGSSSKAWAAIAYSPSS